MLSAEWYRLHQIIFREIILVIADKPNTLQVLDGIAYTKLYSVKLF